MSTRIKFSRCGTGLCLWKPFPQTSSLPSYTYGQSTRLTASIKSSLTNRVGKILRNVYFYKSIKVRTILEKIMKAVVFLVKIQYWLLKWYLLTLGLLEAVLPKKASEVTADLTAEVRWIKPVVPSSWLYRIAHKIPWCCAKLQELKRKHKA